MRANKQASYIARLDMSIGAWKMILSNGEYRSIHLHERARSASTTEVPNHVGVLWSWCRWCLHQNLWWKFSGPRGSHQESSWYILINLDISYQMPGESPEELKNICKFSVWLKMITLVFFSTTPSDPQFAPPSLHQLRHCPIWCLDEWKMMAIATKGNAGNPYFFTKIWSL